MCLFDVSIGNRFEPLLLGSLPEIVNRSETILFFRELTLNGHNICFNGGFLHIKYIKSLLHSKYLEFRLVTSNFIVQLQLNWAFAVRLILIIDCTFYYGLSVVCWMCLKYQNQKRQFPFHILFICSNKHFHLNQ